MSVPGGKMQHKKTGLNIYYDEGAIEERRDRSQDMKSFSLRSLEVNHIITKDPIAVAYKKRVKYAGSSASTGIGPVYLAGPSTPGVWTKTYKEKKALYGKQNRIAPGGRTPGVTPEMAKTIMRKDDDLEMVFYFALPENVHYDNFTTLNPHRIFDMTSGDGAAAMAAMRLNKPYDGICLTEVTK
jgi:putative transposon-encoded protein